MANRTLIFVFTVATAVVLTGCSDPYSQKRLQRRKENREQFIRRATESENRRPAKLQKTFNMFEDMHQRKIEQFERAQREIGYYVW